MVQVAVDAAQLGQVRARLEHLAADLEAVAARMASAPGAALGARRLVDALDRARSDWRVHAGALRDLAEVAAADLGSAAAAYEACEQQAVARTAVHGPPAVLLPQPPWASGPAAGGPPAPLGPLDLPAAGGDR